MEARKKLTRKDFTGGGTPRYSAQGSSRVWVSSDEEFSIVATDFSWRGMNGVQRYSMFSIYRRGSPSKLLACTQGSWRTMDKTLPNVRSFEDCIAFLNALLETEGSV